MSSNLLDESLNKTSCGITNKDITCIICPIGCNLKVSFIDGSVIEILGYNCKKGMEYGYSEAVNPTRILTTTIRVEGGVLPVLPVKSDKPLPKNLLFECMKIINLTKIKAPIRLGDMVIENILDSGVNIIATRNIDIKCFS